MTAISSPPENQAEVPMESPKTLVAQVKTGLGRTGGFLRQQGALVALVIVVTFSFIRYDNFDSSTITSILDFNTQFGLIALGMTFVIMTGGIDLSVGGIAALSSVVVALSSPHGFFIALLLGVMTGAIVGAVNGFIVAWMRLPPFITTLATLYIIRGVALRMINDAASINLDQKSDFVTISSTTFGNGFFNPPLPFTIVLMVVAFLIAMFVLRYTRFGRYVLTIGGNMEAARLMGLPIKRTLLLVYILSGALAGLAGVLLAINLNGGSATEGVGWELIAIAAVVVGGTLLSGGVGSISGTFIGVLLLGMIVEIIQLKTTIPWSMVVACISIPSGKMLLCGLFLFVVVLLQSQLQRRRHRQKA